jgi:signal transduction histidine kinase/CheY-like chemotaxis protein
MTNEHRVWCFLPLLRGIVILSFGLFVLSFFTFIHYINNLNRFVSWSIFVSSLLSLVIFGGAVLSIVHLRRQYKARAKLLKNYEDLKIKDEHQHVFLGKISHELLTPVNAICNFTDLLARQPLNGEAAQMLNHLQVATETIQHILRDFLDVVKLRKGVVHIERMDFEVGAWFEETCAMLSPKAGAKKLAYQVRNEVSCPMYVAGDPWRLRQVLLNLISNAIKYTDEGFVFVHMGVTPSGCIALHVSDSGRGMTAEQQEQLFKPFANFVKGAEVMDSSGLGLAITQQLVQLLEGSIRVESTQGTGSTFTVEVPFVVKNAVEAKHVPTGVHAFQSLRLLYADDQQINQEILTAMAGSLSVELDSVPDGAAAVSCAQKSRYDLIIFDLNMPVMDGFTAAQILRAQAGYNQKTPLIALTGAPSLETHEKAKKSGFDIVLEKPFRRGALLELLEKYAQREIATAA